MLFRVCVSFNPLPGIHQTPVRELFAIAEQRVGMNLVPNSNTLRTCHMLLFTHLIPIDR